MVELRSGDARDFLISGSFLVFVIDLADELRARRRRRRHVRVRKVALRADPTGVLLQPAAASAPTCAYFVAAEGRLAPVAIVPRVLQLLLHLNLLLLLLLD